MNTRSLGSRRPGGRPTIFLIARREIFMRLRSRVFTLGTIGMVALVVVGVIAASLLVGKTTPVRVGFSGGSQALEPTFTASAAALGASMVRQRHRRCHRRESAGDAGTLDVLVTGPATAPTAVVKDAVPSAVDTALYLAVLERVSPPPASRRR